VKKTRIIVWSALSVDLIELDCMGRLGVHRHMDISLSHQDSHLLTLIGEDENQIFTNVLMELCPSTSAVKSMCQYRGRPHYHCRTDWPAAACNGSFHVQLMRVQAARASTVCDPWNPPALALDLRCDMMCNSSSLTSGVTFCLINETSCFA